MTPDGDRREPARTRWTPRELKASVLVVALLNLAYMVVEMSVALAIGSVSLVADSVDFFEDFAVNILIVVALGWSARSQAVAGKALALIILLPALAAAWTAFLKAGDPEPPDPVALVVTAGGALAVNLVCSLVLARFRHGGGSLTRGAFLAARNDVVVNLAIIVMGLVTAWTLSGWPDVILGLLIIVLNVSAAREVWETATEEHLAARALAGDLDDD
ncbi:cation transporter [Micrococcus sp. TA1]|uniref:cation transporter n=1 Tax=Micrococcus sp. TA1 TaxID=681627 RepID=UPI001858DDD8|nr:Co/Zn/Cd efflux system component [Micrococcus sp. TA1]HRO94416.1 cation transporter [Citricoccus sp.]